MIRARPLRLAATMLMLAASAEAQQHDHGPAQRSSVQPLAQPHLRLTSGPAPAVVDSARAAEIERLLLPCT